MLNIFFLIEKLFYGFREAIWNLPEAIFGDHSLRSYLSKTYRAFIPYSHFTLAFIILIIISIPAFIIGNLLPFIHRPTVLIEGVIMGTDQQGAIQKLTQVNPILPSNVQIERDLVEIIYEPLVRFEYVQSDKSVWDTTVVPVLAESVVKIREGADYRFNLRKNVIWHDGIQFTSDDVISTFDLVSQLESTNAYIRAIKQLNWEKIDDFTIRVCTKGSDTTLACNRTQDNPILSNFLELISIKIVPKHKLQDVTPTLVNTSAAELFRAPVGTGRYKFQKSEFNSVSVIKNNNYYEREMIPSINTIEFRFYRDLNEGISALENGSIHSLVSSSTQYKSELNDYPQINTNLSPVLLNQYWAVYFNLRKDPSGKSIGSEFFQDSKVRSAIAYAINRGDIMKNALQGVGSEARGPIPDKSEYFNNDANWRTYNITRSAELLDEAGWELKSGDKYRTNANGQELSFSLYFVNSFDRLNVAKAIKRDLEEVGINMIIDRRDMKGQDVSADAPNGWSLQEINNQFLSPRLFDAILYGMNTFIDPDRYELFHSSQDKHPGLNISGYVGSEPTVKIRENRQEGESSLETVPKVDKLLEDTRRLDPQEESSQRTTNYQVIQQLIADDSPVVFLYHPQFIYYTHSVLESIDLTNVSSVEGRFKNIEKFKFQD